MVDTAHKRFKLVLGVFGVWVLALTLLALVSARKPRTISADTAGTEIETVEPR